MPELTAIAEQALEKFRAGDFESAAALFDCIAGECAGHPDLTHLGAMIELRRRRLDAAERLALRAVTARPASAVFRYTRAKVLTALQRYDEALDELRHVLRIDPRFHRAHVRIWEIMGACGRLADATAIVKQRLAALDAKRTVDLERAKVRIPDTTLCCIDCNNHALAVRALTLSLTGCEFPRAVLFTDRNIGAGPVQTVLIDPVRSLTDYSTFVMKRLLHYVDTEYVLLIQWDGYVVNAQAWSEEFLLFDYIGARWPHEALGIAAEHAVGNGGFSLRSRALLEALQDPRIVSSHPEDAAICRNHRRLLEQEHGIAFAPATVADRFSFEHIEPAGPTFGFHGQINLTRFVDDPAIRLLTA